MSSSLRVSVRQCSAIGAPPPAAASAAPPTSTKAASPPAPDSTWRSTSLNAAEVRPPTNHSKKGALPSSSATSHGLHPPPLGASSSVNGVAASAFHPLHLPVPSSSESHALAAGWYQCRLLRATAAWYSAGSASHASREARSAADDVSVLCARRGRAPGSGPRRRWTTPAR